MYNLNLRSSFVALFRTFAFAAVLAGAPLAVMWADARAPAVLADAPPAVMRADAGASADAGAPAVLADAPDAVMLADAHVRQSLQLLLWRLCRPCPTLVYVVKSINGCMHKWMHANAE